MIAREESGVSAEVCELCNGIAVLRRGLEGVIRAVQDRIMTIPHDDEDRPDLQELVRLRGEQYARSIGEEYDPEHCPHHGGYRHITPADWAEWDRAVAAWQLRCRAGLAR